MLTKHAGMGYRAVVLPCFGTFVLSRRLESVLGFIEKNDGDRAYAMLKEAYENLGQAVDTDIVGRHMDAVCSGIAVAMSSLESAHCAKGTIESTLLYVRGLMAGLAESYDVVVNRPEGRLAVLPERVRVAIASAAF